MALLDQPITSMTARPRTPTSSKTVAAVCRASCSLASRTPASASRAFHSYWSRRGSIGLPLGWANIHPPSCHSLPACSRSRSCILRCAMIRANSSSGRAIPRRPAFDFHQAAAVPLRAPAGVAGAAGRARRRACALVPFAARLAGLGLVKLGRACVRVIAAVLPSPPLEGLPDLERLGFFVQPPPFQAQRLALPDTERQRDHEPDAVALGQRGAEQ